MPLWRRTVTEALEFKALCDKRLARGACAEIESTVIRSKHMKGEGRKACSQHTVYPSVIRQSCMPRVAIVRVFAYQTRHLPHSPIRQ
jgi:hypothetical protein